MKAEVNDAQRAAINGLIVKHGEPDSINDTRPEGSLWVNVAERSFRITPSGGVQDCTAELSEGLDD